VFFGFSFDGQMAPQSGLPVVLIQGYRMLGDAIERHAFEVPCPKMCVAGWLVEAGREVGVPANELVHVPIGVHHDRFRVTRPVASRPPRRSEAHTPACHRRPEGAARYIAK
jgi:hypothetical protein